ncbi:MAG: hypothetical protein RL653_4476, partial [Pseudomonadota bacterium]
GVVRLQCGDILSFSADHSLRTWSGETGELRAVLAGHADIVRGAYAMPGERVLSFSSDATLRLWDAASGIPLAVMKGHSADVTGVALLPGGQVLSYARDNTLRTWDGSTGAPLAVLEGHTDQINGAWSLPDGRILSYARDHTLRLWDVGTGAQRSVLSGHTAQVRHALLLSVDRVMSWGMGVEDVDGPPRMVDNTLRIWDTTTGSNTAVFHGPDRKLGGLLELPGGRVASFADQAVQIWDARTGAELASLCGHSDTINGFQVVPEDRLLSWSSDSTLCLWSLDPVTLRGQRAVAMPPAFLAMRLAKGRFISLGDDSVDLWSASGRRLVSVAVKGADVAGIAPLDEGRVGLLSTDNSIQLISFRAGGVIGQVRGERGQPRGMTSFTSEAIIAWDARLFSWDGSEPRLLDGERVTEVFSVSRDQFASCSITGTVRLWHKATLEPCVTLLGHEETVLGMTWLSGDRLLSWSADRTLRTWDGTSGALLAVMSGHSEAVGGATGLGDGRVVSWSEDPRNASLIIWDGVTGRSLRSFRGHEGEVHGCLALPGDRLLSWSEDGTLRIWSVESGQVIHVLEGHAGAVHAARVLEDGRLLSFSVDGTLRLWDVNSGHPLGVLASPSDWSLCPGPASEAATRRMFHHCLDVLLSDVRDAERTGDVEGGTLVTAVGGPLRIYTFVE